MDIALFSPASLFADPDGDSNDEETKESHQNFVERKHQFPGMELIIREFSFHQLNANLLWPGTFAFAEWLVQNRSWMAGRRVIELGSGTGALAIFLHKSFNLDITTSDYDDPDIEDNIAHNCRFNGIIPVLPHIKHSWGEIFPITNPDWNLVIASDILLYACLLPRPAFLMSWRRRIRKEDESLFFNGCDEAGLEVQHLGTRVYCIVPREVNC
ncbi:uncharacterized protein LOC113776512 isoform X3 [Coffea eugenioides]|uniref:uncharacterized protein LOC113776512 isoform X3 n=1 Tax=Coffea eugenioides TaxID=49369 RepID=UPI000F614E6A|nr:uncharacterized protein LOC113776512 isoform X3 [Coffea eugenioides]